MVQSLDRGIRVLELLEQRRSMGVTEVAGALDINKSTAFRLLHTLRLHDLVEQSPETGKYKLSGGILRFSGAFLQHTELISIAHPALEELSQKTKESVHLCVFSNDRLIVVDQVKSDEVVKVNAAIGKEEPIHCSAVGKSVLAFCSDAVRERVLCHAELTAFTERTITDPAALQAQLLQVRAQGFALDDEEMTSGVHCIAAPIFDHLGQVVYSVGISALASRIGDDVLDKRANQVRTVAEALSKKLGYQTQSAL